MSRSFENTPTESWNKLVNEEYVKDIIEQYPQLRNTVAVVLVGHWSGLPRHVETYSAFKEIIVPERTLETYHGLEWYKKVKRYTKVTIVNQDFFVVVKSLLKKKKKIGLIDFDGIETFGKNEKALAELAKEANIPIVVNIGSARGQSINFKNWCKKNCKRKTQSKYKSNFKCYELNRLAPEYIAKHFKNYVNEFCTYKGRSNMYMQISIRKDLV